MNILKKHGLTLGGLLLLSSTAIFATECSPKWCESQHLSDVEKLVCEDSMLGAADSLMGRMYAEVMSYQGKEGHEGMWYREVLSNQRDWAEKRKNLKTKVQIMDAYMSRNQDLYSVLQNRTGK